VKRPPLLRLQKANRLNPLHHAPQGWKAKMAIRAHVLDTLTPARTVVFDAFAGDGQMYREIWQQAAAYTGCDEHWHHDDRCCFVADNRRVLRAIDLAPFTCFDLDAYGSPWEQAIIIAARRPRLTRGERIGFVLTEGTSLRSRLATVAGALTTAAGLVRHHVGHSDRLHGEVITRALHNLAFTMGGRIVKHWQANNSTGARMRYIGIVIEGAQH
jgi:hypothetical protein